MSTKPYTVKPIDWSPEAELLLGCARTRMDNENIRRVGHALGRRIDWNRVMAQAAYHGTIPLLYRNLASHFSNDVPQTVLDQFRNIGNSIAQRNLALTAELLKLLKVFEKHGIRALPIKGPALAAAAYGDLSLRQFGDLDILVSRGDMLKAKQALIAQGYRPDLEMSPQEEEAYLRSHHDYKFVRPEDHVLVEIQWGITQWSLAFAFDFEEAWKHRDGSFLAGRSIFNVAPETLLLLLCVHGTKHFWGQLKWICDIAELVGASWRKLDWDRLMDRARRLGGERMMLLGLALSRDLLGAPLPGEVSKQIVTNSSIRSLADRVIRRLFRHRADTNLLVELEEGPFFLWTARERWRDKWAIAWRYFPEYSPRLIVPNNGDKEFLKLPPSLSLGYYLVHPVRLMKDYWSESRRRATAGK